MPSKMQHVDSSNIKAVGYDPERQVLSVQFHSGDTYHYQGVPAQEHQAMMGADSVGSHFHANIRGRFDWTKGG